MGGTKQAQRSGNSLSEFSLGTSGVFRVIPDIHHLKKGQHCIYITKLILNEFWCATDEVLARPIAIRVWTTGLRQQHERAAFAR
jgi:hypothetical protein